MKAYKAKSGKTLYMQSMGAIEGALNASTGFCLACGAEDGFMEPDTKRKLCEECGEEMVYSAENMVLLNLVY